MWRFIADDSSLNDVTLKTRYTFFKLNCNEVNYSVSLKSDSTGFFKLIVPRLTFEKLCFY